VAVLGKQSYCISPSSCAADIPIVERFVSLECPRCGVRLDVYDDMSRFACGSCGAAAVVQRRGGTIALKAWEEAGSGGAPEKNLKPGSEPALLALTTELARLVALLAEPGLSATHRYGVQTEISRVTERIGEIQRVVSRAPQPVTPRPSGPEILCMRCGKSAALRDSVCQNCGMSLVSGRVKILVHR
jgi:predicted RNA-binding Zn-ribbon protein involved in translation (DUF1610 family)